MVGGITVAGLVTGTHVIEDIRIAVPHQVAVFIPADLAYKSKDLWRGIGQRRLFQLTGGSGLAVESNTRTIPANNDLELEDFRTENKQLRQQLEEAQRQNVGLQEALQSMQSQLTSILRVLGRLENGDMTVRGLPVASHGSPPVNYAPKPAQVLPQAVGGEVPSFIPDDINPEDAKTSIRIDAEVITGSSLAANVKALREARRKS
jgi:hypothetical protein